MAIGKNLRVATHFYKKPCLSVITWSKKTSKKVIPTASTLEKKKFAVTTFQDLSVVSFQTDQTQ